MRTLSIINQKGGCGKTTSALSIAGELAHSGYRTLLVDLDPQGHCAAGLAIPEQRIDLHVGDAMLADDHETLDEKRLLWRASRNLDLLPSRMQLAGLESAVGGLHERDDREHRLRATLTRFASGYDVCIIDCAPSIGLLTYNALIAADGILIPVDTSFFALQGATRQLSTINAVARRLGRTMPTWVLPTIHDTDSALAEDLLDELRRRFGVKVAPTPIRRDGALREAASFGQPIVEYAPDSPGAQDYRSTTRWLVQGLDVGRGASAAPVATTPPPPAPQANAAGEPDLISRAAQLREHVVRLSGGRTALVEPKPEAGDGAPAAPVRETVETAPGATPVRLIPDQRPTEAHASTRRILGATPTSQGVVFVQPVDVGRHVAVAGAFNDWSTESHRLALNEALGVFEICVPLPEGRHPYKLFIDGRWTNDTFNSKREDDQQGGYNAIVEVVRGTQAAPSVPVMNGRSALHPRAAE